MATKELSDLLLRNLAFTPTEDQSKVIYILSRFILSTKPNATFLLKGYAGTGKTSLMKSVVKSVGAFRMKTFLMSPTGRAAKVLQSYTGKKALTIHKSIYFRQVTSDGSVRFVLKKNLFTNTIFIVDEASMIGNSRGLTDSDLLTDMIRYVFSGQNCRLLIIGDHAQLPPVHLSVSPALDEAYLRSTYDLVVAQYEMTQVKRQELGSGILQYATTIRECLRNESLDLRKPPFDDYIDIIGVGYPELQDEMEKCIAKYGVENVKILTRSNKNANAYNAQIRKEVMWLEEDLSAEDQLMIVKNNYHWIQDNERIGFLANGDMIEVLKISNRVEMHDLLFCDATIRLVDYPDEEVLECKLILDSLMAPGPALTSEQMNALYQSVRNDYAHLPSKQKIKEALKQDPYLNALQVKFSYAITCHKAQGGQWPVILIDRGYFTQEMVDVSYLRWLYTAVTRSTEIVYFVNFEKMTD